MRSRRTDCWGGALFDVNAHVGRSLFGHELTVDALLEEMGSNGVEQAVLSPLKPVGYHFAPENERIAAAVAAHPEKFFGFARVDPWQGAAALGAARRALTELGLVGLFLHPFEEQFGANDEIVFPLMELLREQQRPLLLAGGYPGFSHPSQIGDLARRFPDVTIIATHGGQLNISGLLLADAGGMLRTSPNVIMETSGIYREDFIEDTVGDIGAARVVFGSNAPYMDLGFETLRVRLAHLPDGAKESIGRRNVCRILRLNADGR